MANVWWFDCPKHRCTYIPGTQARISAAEAAQKKSEAELVKLRSHAASLEQQVGQSQAKLKAAQADVTSLQAEALHNKVSTYPKVSAPVTFASLKNGMLVYVKVHAPNVLHPSGKSRVL